MRLRCAFVCAMLPGITLLFPCYAEPPAPSTPLAKDSKKPFVYNEEKDPLAWFLTSAELGKLSETLANAQQAVYYIGSPERGVVGTAFCISKEHRLLITCASVIDDAHDRHKLTLMNGLGERIPMRRFWFHPDLLRTDPVGKPVKADRAPKGEVFPGSPDVAIIQLRDDAPAPRAALPLLAPEKAASLRGHAVGVVNFSVLAHPQWPKDTDVGLTPFRSFGYVTGVDTLQTADPDRPTRPWHLQITAAAWEGANGSPVILQDGTVIGMVNGSGMREPPEKPRIVSMAMLADALWDLLKIVHRQDKVPMPVPASAALKVPFDRAAVRFPSSFIEVEKAHEEVKALLKEKRFFAAARILDPFCESHAVWWSSFTLRTKVWTEYINTLSERDLERAQKEQVQYSRRCLADTLSVLQRNPTDPGAHIDVGYALCWMAYTTKEDSYARVVLTHCTRRIDTLPKEKLRAQYLALRA